MRFWTSLPLYVRILIVLLLGVVVGALVGPGAKPLELPAQLILRLLGALAPPLILVAIVHAILTADIRGAIAVRLGKLLVLNTLVAIFVGLLVANHLPVGSSDGTVGCVKYAISIGVYR